MSDSNTFVLRWVLRNATEITNRTAESDVLEACGFEWSDKGMIFSVLDIDSPSQLLLLTRHMHTRRSALALSLVGR